MTHTPDAIHHFETALAELDQLVEQLESQHLSLQDALKYFERGINLTRTCQQALQNAEQRVEQLSLAHTPTAAAS